MTMDSGAARSFDPLSADIRRCPHLHYAALNARPVQPVAGHPNFWLVSGHDTVSEVLMDPQTYDGQPFPGHEVPVMSAMPPAQHRRLRDAVQVLFTNQALSRLTPYIEEQAQRRTQALLAAGGGDLMSLWANPIPLSVIARIFGFPSAEADLDRLHRYGDAAVRLVIPYGGPGLPAPHGLTARWRIALGMLRAAGPMLRLLWRLPARERRQALSFPNPLLDRQGYPRTGFLQHPELAPMIGRFQNEVLGIFEAHLAQAGDELVDHLMAAYRRGQLSLIEALSAALQILVAGYETTANTLASAVHRLALDPARHALLRAEPARIDGFVEEILRLDAPLQRTLRRTNRAVTLAGVELPENAQLIVMLGAANLDPQRFDVPEQFDPERGNARRHLAFGRGIHMCIGAQLARLEARIALTEFVQQVQQVRLPDQDPPQRLTDKDVGMWGFTRLPVRVERHAVQARR